MGNETECYAVLTEPYHSADWLTGATELYVHSFDGIALVQSTNCLSQMAFSDDVEHLLYYIFKYYSG